MRRLIRYRACLLFLLGILAGAVRVSAEAPAIQPEEYSATDTGASIRWAPVEGADHYITVIGVRGSSVAEHTKDRTDKTDYTISGLLQGVVYDFCVVAFDKNGLRLTEVPSYYIAVMAQPEPLKGCRAYKWGDKKGAYFTAQTATTHISGIEWVVETMAGKKVKKGKSTSSAFYADIPRTKPYILRVRPYIRNASITKTLYGAWIKNVIVPEPVMLDISGTEDKSAFRIRWKKVGGADRYIICGSQDGGKTYKRLAATGKKSTSCVIRKFGKTDFIKGQVYYFKVFACKGKARSIQKKRLEAKIGSGAVVVSTKK